MLGFGKYSSVILPRLAAIFALQRYKSLLCARVTALTSPQNLSCGVGERLLTQHYPPTFTVEKPLNL